jgi:hypothetical protein
MVNTNNTDIRVKVNGQYEGYIKNGTHALNYILSLGMEDLKYMSQDGILNWIATALDTVEEMLTWKKDLSLKKRIIMYRKSLEYAKDKDRDTAMNLFINVALSCEGLGTLSGFGMANVECKGGRAKSKSKIMTNPEKKTYRT